MARRKRVRRYVNPKAPKDQGNGKRKQFKVADHACLHVVDEDGVTRKYSGRAALLDCGEDEKPDPVYVMLTEEMATFYGNLGYIDVELDFGVEKDAEIDDLKSRSAQDAETIAALQRRIAELEQKPDVSGDEQEALDAVVNSLVTSGASSEADPDGAENGSGDNADSGGAEPSSGPSGGSKSETAKPPRRTRRKTL
jgi:hypothetical protein